MLYRNFFGEKKKITLIHLFLLNLSLLATAGLARANCRAFEAPQCIRKPPTLTIVPSQQSARPGEEKKVEVYLCNQDSIQCPHSLFNLIAFSPEDLDVDFSPNLVSVSPGKTGYSKARIQVHPKILVGDKTIQILTSEPGVPAHRTSEIISMHIFDTASID